MSYYQDEAGNNRTITGQFENTWLAGGNVGEQFNAGVGMYDSPLSARLKIEHARRMNGQDPFTGAYLPRNSAPGRPYRPARAGGASAGSDGPVRDDGQILKFLGGIFKAVVLWPVAIAAMLCVVGLGAAVAGRAFDGPTLAAKASREEFANYQPVPLSARFPAKDLAAPVDPAALARRLRAHRPDNKADPRQLRANALIAQSYRCMFQEGCRIEVAKIEPEAGARLPYLAAGFLAPLAAKGDASAARDMCLFAVKLGMGYQDAEIARQNCSQAVYASRQSPAAREAWSRLSESWAMKRARAYVFLDNLQRMAGL